MEGSIKHETSKQATLSRSRLLPVNFNSGIVVDLVQYQAVRGRARNLVCATDTRFQKTLQIGHCHLALADRDHRTDHEANHLVQKPIPLHFQLVRCRHFRRRTGSSVPTTCTRGYFYHLRQSDGMQGADRVGTTHALALVRRSPRGSLKRRKIVAPLQTRARLPHSGAGRPVAAAVTLASDGPHVPHPAPLRWIVERPDGESVPVGLGPRRERGMKRNGRRCCGRRRSPCKGHDLNVPAHAIQRKSELRKFFRDRFKAARIRGIPRMGQTFAGDCWLAAVSNRECAGWLLLVSGQGLCGEAVDLNHYAGRVHALVGAAASLDHDPGRIHASVESGQV